MSDEWPIVRLGGYCSKIGSGATPSGGSSVYIEQGEICLIRSQNIYNDGFKPDGLVFITEDAANKLKNVIVQKNDILLNITGDSVARVCLAREEFLPARVNQHVAIIRPNPNEFDPRYLRYFLASPAMQSFLLTIAAVGATRSALTKVMIETLEVSKPPIQIQTAIADQLESLDNKIHLNTQTNQTLEQIAQAIFKSWFVDFDPVKAKIAALNSLSLGERAGVRARELAELAAMSVISGKDEAQLEQLKIQDADAYQQLEQTAALFPAAMQESELGDIPEGWGVQSIGKQGKVITGKTPPQSIQNSYADSGTPFITPTDITGNVFVTKTNRCLTESGQASIKNTKIKSGSICVTCIGSQMGKTTLSSKDSFANQQINSIIVSDVIYRNYLLLNLRNRREEIFLIGSSGSTMPIINKSTFEKLSVLVPDQNIMKNFDRAIKPIINRILKNSIQNLTLIESRNSLLPKLLSGEIDLSDNALTLALSQGERGLESANG